MYSRTICILQGRGEGDALPSVFVPVVAIDGAHVGLQQLLLVDTLHDH